MDSNIVPVRTSVLKALYTGLEPIMLRLDCLLEDHYKKAILLSQAEHTAALEFRSAAATVELLLLDYFSQSEEHDVKTLNLPSLAWSLLSITSASCTDVVVPPLTFRPACLLKLNTDESFLVAISFYSLFPFCN